MSQSVEPTVQPQTLQSLIEVLTETTALRTEILGLTEASTAWLVSGLAARDQRLQVVLVADQAAAQRLTQALTFWGGQPGILLLPHWELDPYSPLSPHAEIEATRLGTLAALRAGQGRILVTTVRALMQRVIPRRVLESLHLELKVGRDYARPHLLEQLAALGYHRVPLVEDRGSFAVRGDLIDLFPAAQERPLRLTFFGDELEEIRGFETASQRSTADRLPWLQLFPARELILAGEHGDRFRRALKERCDELEIPRSEREALLDEFREGLLAPGRENLLPLNYEQLDTVFDYLGEVRWLVQDPTAIAREADEYAELVASGQRRLSEQGEAHVASDSFYLTNVEFEAALKSGPRIDLSPLQVYRLEDDHPIYRVRIESNADIRPDHPEHDGTISYLVHHLRRWLEQQWRVLVVCHQQGQAERLRDLLAPSGLPLQWLPEAGGLTELPTGLTMTLGPLANGFRHSDEKLVVLTDDEIFGPRSHRRPRRDRRVFESSLADLKEQDFVVHADYGIGRYLGLVHLETGPVAGDFLHLEYAGDDRLYLPVERIEKVQKYQADGQTPKLEKMGSGGWDKVKLRARAAVEELARDLLQIQAKRQMAQGFCYSPPDQLFREFEAAFPHEETPDQLAAIEAVLEDMQSGQMVDRLVCGDVGYGKTEVAIRAAFKAVLDGRQVAVLVPTTVLARQHLETFQQRLEDYPVEIDMLSRFRTAAEQKRILQKTAAGQVDILIGTHRLLQRDVQFKDLGLVVVDEEQRFGVSHKERLKKLRAEVDLLTLTATPIPRTLHLSLAGLRELSIIDTPPVDRQAIRTYVTRFDDDLIRDAILRELRRGGQVFFVHNRVQSIGAMADFLRELVPQAEVDVGHGQMAEKELEQVMLRFMDGRTNVLVCTTIIENGLDIPRANTMIVNRADCFGLSQLYQLRGRVGRSDRRAYAYLLIPGEGVLTRDARERLKVLQEQTELGAGFRIARHDLELRGAGDLLGARQSGQIAAIGFDMYTDLLEETIQTLQGQAVEERIDPEIRLGLSAFFPESYMADPNQRLVMYRRLAEATEDREIYTLADELRDRYGPLPEPAEALLELMKLRVLMKTLRIDHLEYAGQHLVVSFPASTRVAPEQILTLLDQPQRYRFSPDYRLSIRIGRQEPLAALAEAKKELQAFCGL